VLPKPKLPIDSLAALMDELEVHLSTSLSETGTDISTADNNQHLHTLAEKPENSDAAEEVLLNALDRISDMMSAKTKNWDTVLDDIQADLSVLSYGAGEDRSNDLQPARVRTKSNRIKRTKSHRGHRREIALSGLPTIC